MTPPSITVQAAGAAELERVESLLTAAGLPHEGVREKPDSFYLARDGGDLVGCGGVEVHGRYGLLRSVAVAEPHRGEGYGTTMVEALEDRAREAGVETLYLLTTTATGFFRARGYAAVARSTAPGAIRATTQFADRCPDSATCMRKRLR